MSNSIAKKKQVILVVDDDASIRMTAAGILEMQGHSIVEADSGESCIDICQIQRPDMILLDAVMPGIDGFKCAAKIKEIFGIDCPPIFMMTALDDRDSIYRSFDVGITDYFVKPLDWKALPQKIARVALINSCSKSIKKQFKDMNSLKEQISDDVFTKQQTQSDQSLGLNCA